MTLEAGFRLLVVLAHPDPASLNAAIAAAVVNTAEAAGAKVVVQDLYGDGFDPRLGVTELHGPVFADELCARYAAELLAADALVLIHPLWFFQAPAVLKGWVDRVVREDVAFELDAHGAVTGLLTAAAALVITTGNTSRETERTVLGDPVTRFWREVVLGPAGVRDVERLAFTPVRDSTNEVRDRWLVEVRTAVSGLLVKEST